MLPLRPTSLTRRLVVGASVVLLAFFGLTGAALDAAFRESALVLVRERLQAQVYAILAAAEMTADGRLQIRQPPPEPRFSTPASGLYGTLIAEPDKTVWRSASLLEAQLTPIPVGAAGLAVFERLQSAAGQALFALAFPVEWEDRSGRVSRYVVQIAEETGPFEAQLGAYRRTLWGWLVAAAMALVAAQAIALALGLAPLRRLAVQVAEVRAGHRERLDGPQPEELRPLAESLNDLIEVSRRRLDRYRHAMGDLAHSLKTPLAVLRAAGTGAARADPDALRATLEEQVERMDRAVQYQLGRAAASGRVGFGEQVPVRDVATAIAGSLDKVYADRRLQIEVLVAAAWLFRGDRDDLMEILGNLMDNACKWAAHRVRVSAVAGPSEQRGLVLRVEDDGVGFGSGGLAALLARGARADLAVPGQGIGLAVVNELVCDAYEGELTAGNGELGGACVEAWLPGAQSDGSVLAPQISSPTRSSGAGS